MSDDETLIVTTVRDERDRRQRDEHLATKARVLDALAHVTTGLLAGAEGLHAFDLIAHHATDLMNGTGALVTQFNETDSVIRVIGVEGASLQFLRNEIIDTSRGAASRANFDDERQVLDGPDGHYLSQFPEYAQHEFGSAVRASLVRLNTSSATLLVFRRRGHAGFNCDDADLLNRYAQQACIALELADARAAQSRVMLMEDRERIARDLHDRVIQRLFGVGMTVQSYAGALDTPATRRRFDSVVDEIDQAIKELRTAIFTLTQPDNGAMRFALVKVAHGFVNVLGFTPSVLFDGPVDHLDPAIVDHASATLNEALSNVARHAQAKHVSVHIHADGSSLTMRVVDDGIGICELSPLGHGIGNMTNRATQFGGDCTVTRTPGLGTTVMWTIALD